MIRLLQISDIHFTDIAGGDDDYAQMKCKFVEDIEACHIELGKINHILICGDIAFSGLDSQYKKARSFIGQICAKAECDSVLMVPGNHDKKRDVYINARGMMRASLLKGKNTKKLLEAKVNEPMSVGILLAPFKQYYKIAAEFACISDMALKASGFPESDQEMEKMPKFLSSDVMYWTEQIDDLNGYKLFIHGGNTSLLSDKDDGESWNLQEGKHLQVLPLQAYNVTSGIGEIHLILLHHPLSEVSDGKSIEKDIDARFRLQFYGHMHKQSSICGDAIKIYSGALQPPEEGNDYFPVYNVVEIDVVEIDGDPYLKANIFSRKWDGTRFVEYGEETKTGNQALKVKLPQNDEWKKTMERITRGESIEGVAEVGETVSPHSIKHAFLRCENTRQIIKAMYEDSFDNISPNRIKYLAFLKRVEADGRMSELNDLLNRYGK